MIDPEQHFKGIPETNKIESTAEIQPSSHPNMPSNLFFDVDYDQQHAELRDKLMSYRKKS